PEAATPVGWRLAHHLVVHHHDAVGDPRFVRVGTCRHRELGEALRVLRIAHVEDRGAVRAFHVAHIGDASLDHDLPPARAVDVANLADTLCRTPMLASFPTHTLTPSPP